MLSKNKIKLIRSLDIKKFRDSEKIFIAEGHKIVCELLQSKLSVFSLLATNNWFSENIFLKLKFPEDSIEITEDDIKKISFLKNPQEVIALIKIPTNSFSLDTIKDKFIIALDTIQDPGNLGTIIRLADWFGIEDIICSMGTADVYNPKVIQSTMGSISRVKLHYKSLEETLLSAKKIGMPIFGATLSGENIYKSDLPSNGILLLGNESKGISEKLLPLITKQLFIPNYPEGIKSTESLNVGIAAAIICAEFRRRILL